MSDNKKVKLLSADGTVGATAADAAGYDADREYFLIQNTHATQDLHVAFGIDATTANGIKLAPDEKYEAPRDTISRVSVIGSGAGTTYLIATA